jgi:hypothetical protein
VSWWLERQGITSLPHLGVWDTAGRKLAGLTATHKRMPAVASALRAIAGHIREGRPCGGSEVAGHIREGLSTAAVGGSYQALAMGAQPWFELDPLTGELLISCVGSLDERSGADAAVASQ